MSDNERWMEKYNAIVVGEYVRRSQPLPGPFADGVFRFRQAGRPSGCYRADAGFMVHVQPGCRCGR